MSLVYFNFLFIQTIKRRPVWVTWILFLFAIACFLIILPAASGVETLQLWANTTVSFAQTIMAMIAGVFTAILAINIFRDSQEEGTELIVISKPITRNKIVLTKFLVFGFVCLIVNITAVILTSFTILLPETEKTYFAGLVVSMFIGNAVVFAIMGAISILTSVKWAKIGVIVTNLLIVLILLIFQVLASFVFKTPTQALNSKNAAVSSYIYADRDMETGEYTEKNLVDFGVTNQSIKHAEGKSITWQDVDQFWKEDIKGIDPSNILNATDIASQLALTYSAYDLHNFSKRQAKRMFAMSRYYDYDLVKPISPEIIGNDSNVYWLWGSPSTFNNPLDPSKTICYFPGGAGIPLIESYDINTLKGLTNKLPIGRVRSSDTLFWQNVYLEPNEWQQYKEGFNQIYKYSLDYSVKTVDKNDYYYDLKGIATHDYLRAPFIKTENFNKFYELIWYFLVGKANTIIHIDAQDLPLCNYNIQSLDDLNIRFTQFKYYLLFKLYDEEQDCLNNLPNNQDVVDAINTKYQQIRDKVIIPELDIRYEKFLGVKIVDPTQKPFGGLYMECATDENGEYIQDGVLPPGTRVPCYDWIWELGMGGDDEDIIRSAPRNRMQLICTIEHSFISPIDKFLFDSLESPSRSDKYQSELNYTWNSWRVSPNTWLLQEMEIPSDIATSTSFFEYTMTSKTRNWMFIVIWGIIAMMGYAGGSIVYKKYEVK